MDKKKTLDSVDQLQTKIQQFLGWGELPRSQRSLGSYAVGTSTGLARSQNEDAVLIVRVRYSNAPHQDFDLGIVCDGVGGMERGKEAATTAVSAFVTRILRLSQLPPIDRTHAAIMHANEEVRRTVRKVGGTTLSSIRIPRLGMPTIAHAGDSRVYSVSQDNEVHQLSIDDTIGAALNKSPADNEGDAHGSKLIQYVGMGSELEPHIDQISVNEAASFLLTSDGAHRVSKAMLQRVVASAPAADSLVSNLMDLATILGGVDNASVAILPAHLVDLEMTRSDTGIDIGLMSPSRELSIWIPKPSQLAGSFPPHVGGERPLLGECLPKASRCTTRPKGGKKLRSQPKKRSRKKQKPTTTGDQLPFDSTTEIDIDFPEKDGN